MGAKIDILFGLIESDKLEEIKKLIDNNPRLLNARNKDGLTPLKLAVYVKKTEIIEWLIQKGAKLNNKYEA